MGERHVPEAVERVCGQFEQWRAADEWHAEMESVRLLVEGCRA
jgi:hypothetical protein